MLRVDKKEARLSRSLSELRELIASIGLSSSLSCVVFVHSIIVSFELFVVVRFSALNESSVFF